MNIIFLGAPGSGKGTHAKRVMEKFDIPHISTGDILRANIKNSTPLGKLAKGYIDEGKLVPDSVVIDIVKDRLKEKDCRKGFILDGFPRTIAQAQALGEFTRIDVVLNLEVPDSIILHRIMGRRMCVCGESYHIDFLNGSDTCSKCGNKLYQRDDDKEEVVKSRLDVYYKQTAPLIEYYRNLNLVKDVNGGRDKDIVIIDIFKMLEML